MWVRVGQTGYGLYPCSLLHRKIVFSSHLQLLSTSAKIELRATVEPQGARSVPRIRRIAATHEASAFCLPWNRIAAKLRPLRLRHFVRSGPRLSGTGSARFRKPTPSRSDQPPAATKRKMPDIWAGEPRLFTASPARVSAVSQQYHGRVGCAGR